jgi:hypothetical protein
MERILDGKNAFELNNQSNGIFLRKKQYWSIKLSNHFSKMYIASLSKAFVLLSLLIVYLFYPPAAKRKTKRIYILMFLVCYCFLTLYLAAYFDVITLCDSTPTTIRL